MRREFPVFNDGNGNLFIITNYFFDEENPFNFSEHAMMTTMLGIVEEDERLIITEGVRTKGIATSLMHESLYDPLPVLIISGPMFDEAQRNASLEAAVEAVVTNATFH